jgi:hypothetical protein
MFKISSILFVFSVFLVFSCNNKKTPQGEASGKLGTLVIVSGADIHKALEKVYDSLFLRPAPSEPAFYDLLKPDPDAFEKFYFNQRIVLALVTENDLSSMDELLTPFSRQAIKEFIDDPRPEIKHTEHLFARHQHIVYVFAKDAADMERKLFAARVELNKMLTGFELKGQSESLQKDSASADTYFREMKHAFGLGVEIPSGFVLKKKTEHAYLFMKDVGEASKPKTIGLMVHAYPYKNTSDLSYLSIRSERDSACKYLVSGEVRGTYMGTSESSYYPEPSMSPVMLGAYKGMKVKGWWTIRGLSMAGPYVRYVWHVPEKNLLFAFEGFVYQPELEFKERDLRLIEAIALKIK